MNKLAVALAADSAGTVENKTRRQIHKSVNKLFMLSKYAPVGIMIYQGLNFMGVPWETIIKTYREKMGDKKFDSLEEYVNHFIKFLELNFTGPQEDQRDFVQITINYKFDDINKALSDPKTSLDLFRQFIEEKGPDFLEKDQESLDNKFIDYYIEKIWNKLEKLVNYYWKGIPESYLKILEKKYSDIIEEEVNKNFDYDISNESRENLIKIATYSCFEQFTGVVIAGFGEAEMFPSIFSYTIGSIYNDQLMIKLNENETQFINNSDPAAIIPFAQKEMVEAFLNGVTPEYQKESSNYIKKIIEMYPKTLIEIIENSDDTYDTDTLKFIKSKIKDIQKATPEFINDYNDTMDKVKNLYEMPIYDAVITLPKDEIALLAESLVHITSLKRKFSFNQDETVGGDIDVAVISKGDGFVWIKRKHYFDPNLNHHFFNKYFQSTENYKEK